LRSRLTSRLRNAFESIELFAGAGGLALGLESAGFSARALVERDRYCCETLRFNATRYFPAATILQRDIRWLSGRKLLAAAGISRARVDLISGGPPCQSFSICKIPKGGRSARDPRDALLGHFVRLTKKIRPPAFLFENVPGLMSKSGGRIFRDLVRSFQSLGYNTAYSVMNAVEFGVPQHRRRLFVVGSLNNLPDPIFPQPTHGPSNKRARLSRYVSIREAFSNLAPHLPNQRIPANRREKRKMLASLAPGSEWKHWRHRDRWNGPSRCLTAHCRDDWVHPREPRAASVRELACLQAYPNDYVFRGPFNAPNNSPRSFQYRQVGNSVPVLMAKVIGEALINSVFRSRLG
jgi:DNA (cytosine-5)-methyltransferase 1